MHNEKHSRPTQCERILQYLTKFGSITQYEALADLGVMRLASRISEIRHKRGYRIESTFIKVKNRFGEQCSVRKYYLSKEKAQ